MRQAVTRGEREGDVGGKNAIRGEREERQGSLRRKDGRHSGEREGKRDRKS